MLVHTSLPLMYCLGLSMIDSSFFVVVYRNKAICTQQQTSLCYVDKCFSVDSSNCFGVGNFSLNRSPWNCSGSILAL